MILAVCPNPAIDRISEACLSAPEKVKKIKRTVYSAGGKGINVARTVKKLGGQVIAAGLAGGFAGRFLESLMAEEGIRCFFAKTGNPTRMNATLLDPASRKELHIVDEGPRVTPGEAAAFRELFEEIIHANKIECAVFSGSIPPGCPPDFYRGLIRTACEKGIKTALDSSGPALKNGLKAKPDFIKPNLAELEELAGGKLATMTDRKKFAAGLGAPEAIVSMGRRGAFVSAGRDFVSADGTGAPGMNSVGSGDVLLAGYVFSRLSGGKTVEEALLWGTACARANLVSRIPGDISARKARGFLSKITVKREKA